MELKPLDIRKHIRMVHTIGNHQEQHLCHKQDWNSSCSLPLLGLLQEQHKDRLPAVAVGTEPGTEEDTELGTVEDNQQLLPVAKQVHWHTAAQVGPVRAAGELATRRHQELGLLDKLQEMFSSISPERKLTKN